MRLREVMHACDKDVDGTVQLIKEAHGFVKRQPRKSSRSTAFDLRLWHSFAVNVLLYDGAATILPKTCLEVVKFTYLFTSNGMCDNYVSHLRWACD